MSDSPSDGSLTDDTHLDRIVPRVDSLDRAIPFYRDVVSLVVEHERDGPRMVPPAGETPVVALDEDSDVPERGRREVGLSHLAVRMPDRGALDGVLARVRTRVSDTSATLPGASDHLVNEALYFRDPEGNDVKAYRDRLCGEWPWTDDRRVLMDTPPLDLGTLADDAVGDEVAPAGTDLGHVHLEVTNAPRSRNSYADVLGMRVRDEGYPGAAFVAAGEYHRHVDLNSWNTRSALAGGNRDIEWFEIAVSDAATFDAVRESLADTGHEIEQDGSDESGSGDDDATDAADASTATESLVLPDPDGIGVHAVRSRRRVGLPERITLSLVAQRDDMIASDSSERRCGLTPRSPALDDGCPIPRPHGYAAANESSPLRIGGVPPRAASLALVTDDPDAVKPVDEMWDHWFVWNVAPETDAIVAGETPPGAVEGMNSYGERGYGGPNPPDGEHTYQFLLYMLDAPLDLDAGATKAGLKCVIAGHAVAETKLAGSYAF